MRRIASHSFRFLQQSRAVLLSKPVVPNSGANLNNFVRPLRASPQIASRLPVRFSSEKPVEDVIADDILADETAAVGGPSSADNEVLVGDSVEAEFQAETRKLLDIVACSIYTDKEIFVRELISNAADAMSKMRHLQLIQDSQLDPAAADTFRQEIHLRVDEAAKTFTIVDTGIGMNKEELASSLGTICRSGTQDFVARLNEADGSADASSIIGQFGVGFYSIFMCCKYVKVYTRSALTGSRGYLWESDGSGKYKITACDNVDYGTKIVLSLKESEAAYSVPAVVERIVKKYSNFVPYPIFINGKKINTVDALWLKSASEVSEEQHRAFFRFMTNQLSDPLFHLMYRAEGPVSANCLLYIPSRMEQRYGTPTKDSGVSLYCRKVLIQAKTRLILPEWLRFVVGVVDSEDLPLNISREHTQDSPLIRRLSLIVTKRVIKFLQEMMRKEPTKFSQFYKEFSPYLKEGVCADPTNKKECAKLLRFKTTYADSDKGAEECPDGYTTFDDYMNRKKPLQRAIFYFMASDPEVARHSPYMEMFADEGIEVLLIESDADTFTMTHLDEYQKCKILNIENAEAARHMTEYKKSRHEAGEAPPEAEKKATPGGENEADLFADELSSQQQEILNAWMATELRRTVRTAKASDRLTTSPVILTEHPDASIRRMMMQFGEPNAKMNLEPQKIEYNPKHPVIRYLYTLITHPEDEAMSRKAHLVAEQLVDNALVAAGLLDDSRLMLKRLNVLLKEFASLDKVEASRAFEHEAASRRAGIETGSETKTESK